MFVIGLALSWGADVADGHLARKMERESVLGAQLDALADRVTVLTVAVGSVVLADGSLVAMIAATLVWVQFGVVDQLLFGQFLRFGLWTPDEFHLRHVTVWWLNWSTPAKLVSGMPAGLIALGGPAAFAAMAIAVALIVVRLGCYGEIARVMRLENEPHHIDLFDGLVPPR